MIPVKTMKECLNPNVCQNVLFGEAGFSVYKVISLSKFASESPIKIFCSKLYVPKHLKLYKATAQY